MNPQTDSLTRLAEEFPEIGLFAAEVRQLVDEGKLLIDQGDDERYLEVTLSRAGESSRYINLCYQLEPEDPDEPWIHDDLLIYFWDDYFHLHLDDLAHGSKDDWTPTAFRDMLRALIANKVTLYTSLAADGSWNGSWIRFHDEFMYLNGDVDTTPGPDYEHSLQDGVRVSVTNWSRISEETFRIVKEVPKT